jgi:hypothetical protein
VVCVKIHGILRDEFCIYIMCLLTCAVDLHIELYCWLGHYATSWKVAGSIPDDVIRFLRCTMALESTQPLTAMSARNLPGGKGWPAHKADNLTTIFEQIV